MLADLSTNILVGMYWICVSGYKKSLSVFTSRPFLTDAGHGPKVLRESGGAIESHLGEWSNRHAERTEGGMKSILIDKIQMAGAQYRGRKGLSWLLYRFDFGLDSLK